MWCGYDTKKNSKKVLFAWQKPAKTRFLTSSSKQIIIIIKQTVTEYDKVGQSCHAGSITTNFYSDWLVSRQFPLFCLSIKEMFAIYFCIILCLFQGKKTEMNSILLKQMICTYKRVQLADKGFFERNLSTWLWSTGWLYNATAIKVVSALLNKV